MSKLKLTDVEWGEFRVGKLFDKIERGKCKNEKLETKTIQVEKASLIYLPQIEIMVLVILSRKII